MACPTSNNAFKVAQSCGALLGRAGINTSFCLGCGVYGCVFPARDGLVAKVFDTAKPGGKAEFKASWILAHFGRLNRHSALPIIYNIYRLPQKCLGRHTQAKEEKKAGIHLTWLAVVVVREDLKDLARTSGALTDALFLLEMVAYREASEPWELEAVVTHWRKKLAGDYALSVFETALDLHQWARRNNLKFSDTHKNNWGVRSNGQIVLRDLGFTSDASSKELPDVAGKVSVLSGLAGSRRGPICLHGLRRDPRSRRDLAFLL